MIVAETLRKNAKITRMTSPIVSQSVCLTSAIDSRIVCERSKRDFELEIRGHLLMESRQQLLDAVHDGNGIGARLLLHRQRHSGLIVFPECGFVVLNAVNNPRDLLQAYRVAISIRDDQRAEAVGITQLAVGLDGVRFTLAVESTGRQIYTTSADGLPHFVNADAVRRQLVRIHLDANGVFLRSEDHDLRDTADHGEPLREHRLRVFVHLRQRDAWPISGS